MPDFLTIKKEADKNLPAKLGMRVVAVSDHHPKSMMIADIIAQSAVAATAAFSMVGLPPSANTTRCG